MNSIKKFSSFRELKSFESTRSTHAEKVAWHKEHETAIRKIMSVIFKNTFIIRKPK